MKIAVIGATGMVGSRTVAEAVRREHTVDAYSRSGKEVEGAESAHALDLADTASVAEVISGHDYTVITTVSGRTGDYAEDIRNHRDLVAAQPEGKFLVVGGAGALYAEENTMLKDTEGFPEQFKTEADAFAEVYKDYMSSHDVDWTMLAPAPMIAPGDRTGTYKTELDRPAGDSVSAEDFAVALIDEAESQSHQGMRFTVAN
ncbi:NAD(P)-dependent oxidoreductase [Kocuria massiliensis]|jgi:putative NADH-flavin reductase|uniref:NAD(P)-dependent oxidoreductase n=1 Tax=Kocuria massiliensis TaxID=1926282 RepID=UPI00065F6C39|nr:NAD(P)H-binding protein [Kocuria massiliensis]MCT1368367.1 NAD(P)H-binding protein [Rothia sp. p3-SID1597]